MCGPLLVPRLTSLGFDALVNCGIICRIAQFFGPAESCACCGSQARMLAAILFGLCSGALFKTNRLRLGPALSWLFSTARTCESLCMRPSLPGGIPRYVSHRGRFCMNRTARTNDSGALRAGADGSLAA